MAAFLQAGSAEVVSEPLTEQFWIELIRTGPTGVVTVGGFLLTFVGSLVAAWKGISNGRKATKIQQQTNGRFSEMIQMNQELRDELKAVREMHDAEVDQRIRVERQLRQALSILSAREGKPVIELRGVVRHDDDLGDGLPPAPKPAAPLPSRRRRADRLKKNGDREADKD